MSVEKRDYYEILSVEQNAAPDNIKRAYRKMALKYHPDRNQGDNAAETKFKEAAEAYEVLSDPGKRQRYDQLGHAGVSGAGVHDFSHMGVEDIFSMFGDLFGGLGGGGSRRRGADLQTEVQVTLSEVKTGSERSIEFERVDFCEECAGSGAAPGSTKRSCPTCAGYGQVEQTGGLGAIFGRVITTCPACRGKGQVISTPCRKCRGTGRFPKHRVVTVRIPAGIHDGQAVRVRGEGEPGENGSSRGDLHCYVSVKPHPFFERNDNNIICRFPITFTQAALGAKVEVPTLSGKGNLTIPRGTQSGQTFRLAGQGVPHLRTGRMGDELVQVVIDVPKKLSREQQTLLRQYAETEHKSVAPESKKFFEKLVSYFAGEDVT